MRNNVSKDATVEQQDALFELQMDVSERMMTIVGTEAMEVSVVSALHEAIAQAFNAALAAPRITVTTEVPVRTCRCDGCDREIPVTDRVIVALPRPSDPSELCAVMYMCSLECAGVAAPQFTKTAVVGTAEYIGSFFDDDQMDETSRKYGYVFLSI